MRNTQFLKDPNLKRWMMSVGLLSALTLAGCGDAKDDDDSASLDTGTLQIAITDAEEDFLTYRIDINSINLVREDGVEVSVLPASTDVDFVQYQELSEMFASLAVPRGTYTSVTLDLDYSEAEIVIQDDAGDSVNATAVDDEGATITEFSVSLTLNDEEELVVSPGKISQVTLDLDLAASNTILSTSPAVVQVEPYMLATATVDEDREHRVRSLLNSVDTDSSTFNVDILPMRKRHGQYGSVDVTVTDETMYEIDGVEYTGADGLTALATKDVDTPVVSYGQRDEDGLLASIVHAGSSVAWADKDVLKGIIIARTENSITLNGAVIEPTEGRAFLKRDITLNIGDETEVTGYRLGDADISNLSVGQRVLALGDVNEDNTEFDATAGTVRMKANQIAGEITQASPLVLDLLEINKRNVDVFDMSGTGVDSDNDADIDAYEIDTASLNISNLASGDWIAVTGYPTAFGAAPYDFDATAVVRPDLSSVDARYNARFLNSDESNSVTIENDQLVLGEAFRDRLHFKGLRIELSDELVVSAVAGSEEEGRFGIRESRIKSRSMRGHGRHQDVAMYLSFDDFISELSDKLDDGEVVSHLIASGLVNGETGVMTASHITVSLK